MGNIGTPEFITAAGGILVAIIYAVAEARKQNDTEHRLTKCEVKIERLEKETK